MAQNQQIMCSVNSCHYWKSGNRCDANMIMVTADSFADKAPDRIDAPMASAVGPTPTENCMETCCKTFSPKGSGRERADDVVKS
ncbi:DUF1540 domain-containing protein [Gelria sp. Kuro-4]|uniref:DUF1540 domain-containing protein n=1 Tax=Gelria sp. Kuro-4 TaxID=2796927 RepID=UPI001BEEC8C8|nr:DUF1540 domain-containing protein [Gelria sp. Kuro-4]BCV24342.1 hypothetical protein kuro4_11150 [Gelria sp. Kuro-4]